MNLRCIKAPNELISFTDPRIRWPMLGSIKYDGHRMVNLEGTRLITPSGKDHVNKALFEHFHDLLVYCAERHLVTDGELWSPIRPFNEIQSLVRTHYAKLPDDLGYYIFDLMAWDEWEEEGQVRMYAERNNTLLHGPLWPHVHFVEQHYLSGPDTARAMYEEMLSAGHEGIMLRSPTATYKHGRCTLLESHLLKFKNFVTADAIIVDFEQMQVLKADVQRSVGANGLLERTYRQDDYEPTNAIGSFVCRDATGNLFRVKPGKGHTLADRHDWFAKWETLKGTGVEFSHMPHGALDKPRLGTLVRFRPELSEERNPSTLPGHLQDV